MNLTVCPLRGPGSIPSHGGVFQGMAGHTLPAHPAQPRDVEEEG